MTAAAVNADAIETARPSVARFAWCTPTLESGWLSDQTEAPIHLKLDSLQPTGSFKIRGAAARIGQLDDSTLSRGVITASTGNHGRAVAHVARQLGIPATVCLSDNVPPGKVEALRRLGCHLDVGGGSQDAASERAAQAAAADGGPTFVSIFDPGVIIGHGTCGLEILEQMSHVRTVIVPVSSGGLISGIAVAIKAHRPDTRVIGVSMERGAVMHASLEAGHPVELPEAESLADSLQGGIGLHNDTSFSIVQELVDDLVLVSEEQIADAMHHALAQHRIILEGAGAVGIAALASGTISDPAGPVVVVCSGANAELPQIANAATRQVGSY